MFASEIKEAEAASFASGPSLNTLVDNMSESDGVSYIYYNLGGAANNINNCGYITPKQKFMGLREPHKYGYKFDGWYLDEHFSKDESGNYSAQFPFRGQTYAVVYQNPQKKEYGDYRITEVWLDGQRYAGETNTGICIPFAVLEGKENHTLRIVLG